MTLVLPKVPTFGEEFGRALGIGAGEGLEKGLESRQKMRELAKENEEIFKETGIKLHGINDPELRKKYFENSIKTKAERAKALEDAGLEQESYHNIEDIFGKKFADVWKAAPQGGRTELIKQGLDIKARGENLDELLQGFKEKNPEQMVDQEQLPASNLQMKDGKIPKEYKWPDFSKAPKGYTPKDWKDERKEWRKENSPVFLENKTKLQNSKRDEIATKKLNKLNESRKLPEGFERLLINPTTGDPYGVAQITESMSPETQEWIKETARFQNRAKDAFGARVTNFDLVSYMKQFPGLLNSYEGRKRILNMMMVNNKLDQLYESALEQVYQHYGLNGIPQEKADELAQNLIKEETEKLKEEYMGLDEQNQEQDSFQLSGRMVDVIGPDGQEYEIDQREIEKLPPGFKVK